MKEQIRLLEELQEIDKRISSLERENEFFPKEMERLDEGLGEEEKLVIEVREIIEGHEKEKRDKDDELSFNNEQLHMFEGRLKEIKTNTEYQASLREIDTSKKRNLEIENELLELMEQVETESSKLKELEETFNEKKAEAVKEQQALKDNHEEGQKKLKKVVLKRGKKVKEIDPKVSKLYETLKPRLGGQVLAAANAGACSGCNMHIPPQLINDAMRLERIYQCPNCLRIIVAEPQE